MTHAIEHAPSGRAKCRGCDTTIRKGELRFGERRPNAFGEGEMTLWFHLPCGAYKRPEPFLAMLEGLGSDEAGDLTAGDLNAVRALEPGAEFGIAHSRVPRIDGAGRAPTGRARCRSCRELIEKDSWRIGLVFFEEQRFEPSGFIHASCAEAYFGTRDVLERLRHFNQALDAGDIRAIEAAMQPRVPQG